MDQLAEPTRDNAGRLLVNEPLPFEQQDTPSWVGSVQCKTSGLRTVPGKLAVLTLTIGLESAVAYGFADASVTAGYVHSTSCGFRASLFLCIFACANVLDVAMSLRCLGDKSMPSAWDQTKQAMSAVHKGIVEAAPVAVIGLLIMFGPVIVWLWESGTAMIYPIVLQFVESSLHTVIGALTYSFMACHCEMTQSKFLRRLVTGELSYETAVSEYALVNKERKGLSRALGGFQLSFALFMLAMATVLYDWEIRPWGGWHFALIYIMYALSLVMQLSPWFTLHDWPDDLCKELMESTELAWSPSDRSNFATLVTTTQVPIAFFDFEMTPGLRTGLPLVFFGWFLYMTELKQFHGFSGFPFDQVCFNATAAAEGGGGHGHH